MTSSVKSMAKMGAVLVALLATFGLSAVAPCIATAATVVQKDASLQANAAQAQAADTAAIATAKAAKADDAVKATADAKAIAADAAAQKVTTAQKAVSVEAKAAEETAKSAAADESAAKAATEETASTKLTASGGKKASGLIKNGQYYTIKNVGSGKVLDLNAGDYADGTNIQQYARNKSIAQIFKLKKNTDGTWRIACVAGGKSLDVAGGYAKNGANVQTYRATTLSGQKWKLIPDANGKRFVIASALNPKYVLDVDGGSAKSGANVQLYQRNGSDAQNWRLRLVPQLIEDGVYLVEHGTSRGNVLDVQGASRADNANVQLYAINKTFAQKWLFKHTDDNAYTIESLNSGKYLGFTKKNVVQSKRARSWTPFFRFNYGIGFATQSGKVLHAVGSTSASNVVLAKADTSKSLSQTFFLQMANPIEAGNYVINTALKSKEYKTLGVKNNSTSDKANVQLQTYTNSRSQIWRVYLNADGTSYLINDQSGKALAVKNAQAAGGANVWQNNVESLMARRWIIAYDGGGKFSLTSALGKKLTLNVAGGKATKDGNVNVKKADGTKAQKWTFDRRGWMIQDGSIYYIVNNNEIRQSNSSAYYSYNAIKEAYSGTDFIIVIDRDRTRVNIYSKRSSGWAPYLSFLCSCGAPESPTPTGWFTLDKRRGTCSYDEEEDEETTAVEFWVTEFAHDYEGWGRSFHSVLYWRDDYLLKGKPDVEEAVQTVRVQDKRLGMHITNGCVRLATENARWIFFNMKPGTVVYSY